MESQLTGLLQQQQQRALGAASRPGRALGAADPPSDGSGPTRLKLRPTADTGAVLEAYTDSLHVNVGLADTPVLEVKPGGMDVQGDIYANGKVGIGVAQPGNNHANANNLVVGDGTAGGMALHVGTQTGWYAFSRAIADNTDAFDGGMSYSSRQLKLHTNAGAERLTITSSGNVGIGTAASLEHDVYRLAVRRDEANWVGLFKNYGPNAYGVSIDLSGSSGAMYALATYTAANSGFFVMNDAKVGIGIANPQYPLHVHKTLTSDTQATPETVLTLSSQYGSAGTDGLEGTGPRVEFKIPHDNSVNTPAVATTGASIAAVRTQGDDGLSNAALTFAVSDNDETLDETLRLTSSGATIRHTGDAGVLSFDMHGSHIKSPGDGWHTIKTFGTYASTGFMIMVSYEDSMGDGNNGFALFVDSGSASFGRDFTCGKLHGAVLLECRRSGASLQIRRNNGATNEHSVLQYMFFHLVSHAN